MQYDGAVAAGIVAALRVKGAARDAGGQAGHLPPPPQLHFHHRHQQQQQQQQQQQKQKQGPKLEVRDESQPVLCTSS